MVTVSPCCENCPFQPCCTCWSPGKTNTTVHPLRGRPPLTITCAVKPVPQSLTTQLTRHWPGATGNAAGDGEPAGEMDGEAVVVGAVDGVGEAWPRKRAGVLAPERAAIS